MRTNYLHGKHTHQQIQAGPVAVLPVQSSCCSARTVHGWWPSPQPNGILCCITDGVATQSMLSVDCGWLCAVVRSSATTDRRSYHKTWWATGHTPGHTYHSPLVTVVGAMQPACPPLAATQLETIQPRDSNTPLARSSPNCLLQLTACYDKSSAPDCTPGVSTTATLNSSEY